jgi:UDP-2,4-diacetamido-2,4,6-trideoxy-beta-L-altropyranose hydrolase
MSKLRTVLLRADGGPLLGIGHWSRCLELLNNNSIDSIYLFTKYPLEFEIAFGKLPNVFVKAIQTEKDFFDYISPKDIVILDGYDFDESYFSFLNQKDAIVVFISDDPKKRIDADIILNHTPGLKSKQYESISLLSSLFLGGDYSFVGHEYLGSDTPNLSELLICMGGADPANFLVDILSRFQFFFKFFETVNIVSGPLNSSSEQIFDKLKFLPKFKLYKSLSKLELMNLMKTCGAAMLPASTIAMEFAHTRGLLVLFETAANQQYLYKGLIKEKIGIPSEMVPNDMAQLKKLISINVSAQQRKIDGKSKPRFSKLFNELYLQKKFFMREAIAEDIHLAFNWANNFELRKYSFNKEEITFSEHSEWFYRKINDSKVLYLIGFIESVPVGSIRFDIQEKNALISYLVDESWQKMGLGRIMIVEGIKILIKKLPKIKSLNGLVLPENIASVKTFERLGFKKSINGNILNYQKKLS